MCPAKSSQAGQKTPIDFKWDTGSDAGKVYRVLKENGESSIPVLVEKTGLKEHRVQRALGWLACQEKIQGSRDDKTAYVRLRPEGSEV